VRQLAVEHHSDGFADTVMLDLPSSLQGDHSQRRGLDPGMRAANPRPSLEERIMRGQFIGSTWTMNTGCFK
jgi:hypothetical protein